MNRGRKIAEKLKAYQEDYMISIIILTLSIVIILMIGISYYVFPQKDFDNVNEIPRSYMIETSNRIDIQNNYECAAFSSAYILRHFGIEVNGNKLYETYRYKLPDGTISPKGIITFFNKRGYTTLFCKGNIETLKKQISKGVPVIVLVKVYPNKKYLHYVPVVGYDEDYFYMADSLKATINCNEKCYNRKIAVRDFEILWKTWVPFYKNTYVIVENWFRRGIYKGNH